MVSAESTPYDSAHISVLRSSFTDSLQPGDIWDGGGGMDHAVNNMYPTYPTSGNTREKVWSNINGTFSDKDLILVTYTNNVKMGWIAGVVVIELDMSFNDNY